MHGNISPYKATREPTISSSPNICFALVWLPCLLFIAAFDRTLVIMPGRKSEALAFSLVSGINLAMARLADIWDSIGILEDQRVERMLTVKKHIEVLLSKMISEEEYLKKRIGNSINTFQKQLEILRVEMSVEPFELEDDLTALQMEKNLRLHVEALEKERGERLKELQGLQEQDEELCEELSATPFYLSPGILPSRAQLQELRLHVLTLGQEKVSRVAVFSGLREEIQSIMTEIGMEPETSLEREAVCDDTDTFLLTHDNIKALQLLLCQLDMKRKSLTALRDELKGKAACLWTRLDVPDQEQRAFRDSLPGTLSEESTQWQGEVDRLTVLQNAKMEEVTEKIRQELVALWDRCKFGPAQREAFDAHFRSSDFTEELLSRHDEELLKLKAFYEKACPILETVERWNTNWVLFQDFERRASDPSRFSNRGGALLKEAKERVKVQKLLPKLEEELKSAVEAWEKAHGMVFLVWGERASDRITSQWEEYQLQREKEKTDRVTKKTEGTPQKAQGKRTQPGASGGGVTPCKTRKGPNQAAVRLNSTSSTASSSSSGATQSVLFSMSIRPTLSPRKVQQKNRTPHPERKFSRLASYSEFTIEQSRRNGSGDANLNSTARPIP